MLMKVGHWYILVTIDEGHGLADVIFIEVWQVHVGLNPALPHYLRKATFSAVRRCDLDRL